MKAIQYTRFGGRPELVDVEKPSPGPGEVLLKVTASGLCHSDEVVMSYPEDIYPYPMPMTLGHEPAGEVVELGEGATGVSVGDQVIVYGCWGCGICINCAEGNEQLCLRGMTSPGLGQNGGMAEYILVDSVRHLVPIGDLDPVSAASLTDAALTPYAAIKSVQHKLVGGSTTVVIGAGGLGHVAIQLLRTLTATRIVALDIGQDKLDFAKECGAHEVMESKAEAAEAIKAMTNGRGADVVLDFVGIDATGALSLASVMMNGAVVLVGAGGGGCNVGFMTAPFNVAVSTSLWGRRKELLELVEMAKRGDVKIRTTTYSIEDGTKAYDALHAGTILGRAVVVP